MDARFLAGTYREEITPVVGSCLAGYIYPPRISRRVRDPLHATSVVIADGEDSVAIVSCDLIAVPRKCCDEAKLLIQRETGIPPSNVMITATHIHTGPCTADLFISDADQAYLSILPMKIASSVARANEEVSPVRISAARGEEGSLSFNRRFHMRNGSVRTNPGIRNQDILSPAGPIDPEIMAVVLNDPRGRVTGCLFNYANHVDVLGGSEISSDYPGLLARMFQGKFGEGANLVYLPGASGDLNHLNVHGNPQQSGPAQTEFMARRLFQDLIDIPPNCEELSGGKAGGVLQEIQLPRHVPSEEEVARAKAALEGGEGIGLETMYARETMLLVAEGSGPIPTLVQAVGFGNLALVGFPGETFVEIGLETKAGSPFKPTGIVELANDYVGYIATDEAYAQGGYEVRPARSSRSAMGAEDVLKDSAASVLDRLSKVLNDG